MKIKEHQSLRPQARHHTLNQSQLKSLTDNLRLRLRYAKLKVINGWHNQTLNEIESTIYYLLPQNHQNQQRQSLKKKSNTPEKKSILEASLSSSTSSGSSKSSEPHDPSDQAHCIPMRSIYSPSRPISFPTILSSLSKPSPHKFSASQSILLNQAHSNSGQSNLETAFLIKKSNFISSTTLTLPLKYSTPFKKSVKSGDKSDQFSMESNRFWPTSALECPSTGSLSPIRFRKGSLEGLVFKMTGMDSKNNSNDSNRGGVEESEDLFKAPPMEDFQELYKHSSPASFLFNYQHRSILDSSSAKKSYKSNLLNSVSPVRIRSNLHYQSYPHSRLVPSASNSWASPTPNRTQKPNLNSIFTSSSKSKNDQDDQKQKLVKSSQLLPEEEDEEDEDEEEDKENMINLDKTNLNNKSHPLKLTSSLLKFTLHPPPAHDVNVSLNNKNNNSDNSIEDVISNPTPISLDDLDQFAWE